MYARSPSLSQRPAPTTIASQSPFQLGLLFDLAYQDGNIRGPKGPRGTRGNGDISEARFRLCIIPTLMVLSFFFNSRILQTGILQTRPNQFVENQKQNQDNTGRFGMKNLPKRLEFFLPKRPVRLMALD